MLEIKLMLWRLCLQVQQLEAFFVVLPIAHALYKKGAKLSVVLTYLNCACVCRIPMTLWEITMLGPKFTFVRYVVSIPLIIMSSILIEKYLVSSYELENSTS